jgi:hypothetical protein
MKVLHYSSDMQEYNNQKNVLDLWFSSNCHEELSSRDVTPSGKPNKKQTEADCKMTSA